MATYREDLIASLTKECREIQLYLETTPSENPEEVVERGNQLVVYLARTTKMLADAKQLYNVAKGQEVLNVIDDMMEKKLSAKVQNAIIDGICSTEKYLVDWLDRLNSSCTHSIDWCRTLISKNKEEMRLAGMNRT